MPVERERLIHFAYFNSRSYKELILDFDEPSTHSILDADTVVKVWEDGFLKFATTAYATNDGKFCPPEMPVAIDVTTGQSRHFRELEKLSAYKYLKLFKELVRAEKSWKMHEESMGGVRDCTNPCVELLVRRQKTGRWDGIEEIPEVGRLIEQNVHDSTVALAVCVCHELWGTRLVNERMAVLVDTVLTCGLSNHTEILVEQIRRKIEEYRPKPELFACFSDPSPFRLDRPHKGILYFSEPLLRALPIGPVVSGSPGQDFLMKFSLVLEELSMLDPPIVSHSLKLDDVEWCMEAYRLFVEVMQCRNKDGGAIDPLLCNRPQLQVPVRWRRDYNKMGIESVRDLVVPS